MAAERVEKHRINTETGETVLTGAWYEDPDSSRAEALEEWRLTNMTNIQWKKKHRFTKVYHSEKVPPFKRKSSLGYFFVLTKHLSPELNMVARYEKSSGWRPLQKKEMMKILDISKTAIHTFLEDGVRNGILAVHTEKDEDYKTVEQVFCNPVWAFNGTMIPVIHLFLFRNNKEFMSIVSKEDSEYIEAIYKSKDVEELDKAIPERGMFSVEKIAEKKTKT